MPDCDVMEITIDLGAVEQAADRVRRTLIDLRRRFDLSPFEYTQRVRIAPLEIPHSHPVLTLNTRVRNELALLAMYLHEQMHWYVTWYSHAHMHSWQALLQQLHTRYPDPPRDADTSDLASAHLHLVVNWLEIEATARFFPRDDVTTHLLKLPFYRWAYQTVTGDWNLLAAIYTDQGLFPLQYATAMSSMDLCLAALSDEAPTRPA